MQSAYVLISVNLHFMKWDLEKPDNLFLKSNGYIYFCYGSYSYAQKWT